MKKIYMVMLAAILFSASSVAQKGNSFVSAGAGLCLPTGDFASFFKTGVDIYAKGMFGLATSDHVTITMGYSTFKAKGSTIDFKASTNAVPLLLGYRHTFKGNLIGDLFLEPQIGYAIYGYKETSVDGLWTDSQGGFTWAAGFGYIINNKFEIGARYQSGGKGGSSLDIVGIRAGYNFSLKSSK